MTERPEGLEPDTTLIKRRDRSQRRVGGTAIAQVGSTRNPNWTITRTQLYFAGHWVAETGGDPGSLRHLRDTINSRYPTRMIRLAIDKYLGGDPHLLRERCKPGEMEWPKRLLEGAEGWPRRGKHIPDVPDLPDITPFDPEANMTMLPPTWGDVRRWYHETYPLQFRVGQTAPVELVPPTNAPLDDWGAYWTPELRNIYGPMVNDTLINLVGVPHIDDPDELESALGNEATRVPYLCIAGERNIRNGSEEPGSSTYVTKAETTLLNLLALYQLRDGRAVGFNKLCVRSGFTERKTARDLGQLIGKINRPGWPRTVVKTNKDHFAISDETIIVDYRQPAEDPVDVSV